MRTIEDIIDNRLPVYVVTLSDDCGPANRIGYVGTVVGWQQDPVGCDDEPYLEVRFADGKIDCFWPEELRLVFPNKGGAQ